MWMAKTSRSLAVFGMIVAFSASGRANPGDWPMWGYNAARNGYTERELPETMHLQWVRELPTPRRAWPAQLDDGDKLEFDLSYAPVVMGDKIFVPSMVTDSVTAYRITDGAEVWRHYTDGPIRLAPAVWNGRVYAVSDDGHLYCLDAATGQRLWRFRASPVDRLVLGNNRVISMWAARGGPVVFDHTVYFAAGVWPLMGTFVFALDAETGDIVWQNTGDYADFQRQPHGGAFSFAGIAPQGYLAATEDRLVVSGGRSTPALLDRHSGELLHLDIFGKEVGGYRVTADNDVFYNHGRQYRLVDGSRVDGSVAMQEDDLHQRVLEGRLIPLPETGWRFLTDPDDVGRDERWFDSRFDDNGWRDDVLIETSWQPHLEQAYHGAAWYRRTIEIPEDAVGKKIHLFFGGVDEEAWVWLNGVSVGEHAIGSDGWNRRFALDVSDAIKPGQANQITIRVRNTANAGGIWQPVYLGEPDDFMQTTYGTPPIPSLEQQAAKRLPELDGDVFEVLPAHGLLFVTTTKGTLYAFGAEAPEQSIRHVYAPATPAIWAADNTRRTAILERARAAGNGYALFLGADGDLMEQLVLQSDLHIVGIDPDETKIDGLRRRFDAAGLYGSRIALLPGSINALRYPPYISSLIVANDPSASGLTREAIHDLLRPYGGTAFIGDDEIMTRDGPLPDTGQWTHQYADAARTTASHDERVRLPLGILWYGSESHNNILPRHAAGPRPQVSGGRLAILGVETISARDVYTGRELWVREFPGIGHPFTSLAKEEQWRVGGSVYMDNIPGAAYIGSPYVTLPDGIYLRYRGRIFRLAPNTGETLAEFALYPEATDVDPMDWGPVSVYENLLITTTAPHQFDETDLGWVESWNATSSRRLVVMDRFTGETLWSRDAHIGFRHNAIAVGSGQLFVIDGLSEKALSFLDRRGISPETKSRVIAMNATDGREIWQTDSEVFGTYLAYSEEHDVLLESGSRDTRRPLPDEPHSRVVARRGENGEILWDRRRFQFPAAILGERLIPARPGATLNLLTGSRITRSHPITGETIDESYSKHYGCSPMNASSHLLLFRSGAAGFADLDHGSGTGNFGGFKSGCTASMIAADGVLNAPDYTRTCTCSYQNQTSLGLIHMPETDVWTSFRDGRGAGPIQRIGINLGAPGNRRDAKGTLWTPYPSTEAPSPDLTISVNAGNPEDITERVLRLHPLYLEDSSDLNWVAASSIDGLRELVLDDVQGDDLPYRVTLHFAEPKARTQPVERMFDIRVQDNHKVSGFDIVERSGTSRRPATLAFSGVIIGETLRIELNPAPDTVYPPLLSGVEIVRE